MEVKMDVKGYIGLYLSEMISILQEMLKTQVGIIDKMVDHLLTVKRQGGRVFFIGVGGGAGTGSHATNDFMKIAGIPAICLTDNASLLTALTNDEGFDTVFTRQMEMYGFNKWDTLFVFSVGGGSEALSKNITNAVAMANDIPAMVLGVVGRDDGYTAKHGHAVVVVPLSAEERRTAHTESIQLAIDHLLVNAIAERSKE